MMAVVKSDSVFYRKKMNRPDHFKHVRLDALKTPKRIGIAADHGGYELKEFLAGKLRAAGYEVVDFGDGQPKEDDDYPDFIVPLAHAAMSTAASATASSLRTSFMAFV